MRYVTSLCVRRSKVPRIRVQKERFVQNANLGSQFEFLSCFHFFKLKSINGNLASLLYVLIKAQGKSNPPTQYSKIQIEIYSKLIPSQESPLTVNLLRIA